MLKVPGCMAGVLLGQAAPSTTFACAVMTATKTKKKIKKLQIAGARNRLGWCSKSPRLVLKIASAGAQICAFSGGPNCNS